MEFTADVYVIGIWFVAGDEKDWMLTASRRNDDPPGRFSIEYRFRYYSPDSVDPFDGADDKSWYSGTIDAPEWKVEEAQDIVARMIRDNWGARRYYKIVVRGDGLKAYRKLIKAPWAHLQRGAEPIRVTGKGGTA